MLPFIQEEKEELQRKLQMLNNFEDYLHEKHAEISSEVQIFFEQKSEEAAEELLSELGIDEGWNNEKRDQIYDWFIEEPVFWA